MTKKRFTTIVRKYWQMVEKGFVEELWTEYSKIAEGDGVIVGYGSLLNKKSTLSTMPKAEDLGFDMLKGYKRVFNMGGFGTGFLNIEKDPDTSIVVRKWKLDSLGLVNYVIREAHYDFITTPIGITCISGGWEGDITPNISYVYKCVGDLEMEQRINFWETTYNKDGSLTRDFLREKLAL